MNDLEFLRDAAARGVLFPTFAGMVQTVVSAQAMSDHAKVQRIKKLGAVLDKIIDGQCSGEK